METVVPYGTVQGSSPVLKGIDIMQLMAAAAPGASQGAKKGSGGRAGTSKGDGGATSSTKGGKGGKKASGSGATPACDGSLHRLRLPADLDHGPSYYRDEPDDVPDADRLKSLYSKVVLTITTIAVVTTITSTTIVPNHKHKRHCARPPVPQLLSVDVSTLSTRDTELSATAPRLPFDQVVPHKFYSPTHYKKIFEPLVMCEVLFPLYLPFLLFSFSFSFSLFSHCTVNRTRTSANHPASPNALQSCHYRCTPRYRVN